MKSFEEKENYYYEGLIKEIPELNNYKIVYINHKKKGNWMNFIKNFIKALEKELNNVFLTEFWNEKTKKKKIWIWFK